MLVDPPIRPRRPLHYTGRDMKSTHAGHGRQQQRLRRAGRRPGRHRNKVQSAGENKNELLGAAGADEGDIVEKPMASDAVAVAGPA